MKHPTAIAAMVALLGTGGCFEWASPTQPHMAQRRAEATSILDAIDAPSVADVVRTLKDDHGEPKQDRQASATTPDTQASTSSAARSSGGGGGGGGGGFAANTVTITDVLYGGQSVVGPTSPAVLTGDLESAPAPLRITGSDFAYPEDRNDIGKRYLVILDPAFIAQTFIGNPKYKVLLDDAIALQPQDGGTFTANQLDVMLPRKGVLDLMLAGEHTLSVTVGFQKATAKVRFGAPSSRASLAPKITSAKLVKAVDDETDTSEWLIELKGSNYLLDFRKSYAKLNGQRAYWHASYVGATESVGYVHVPDGALQGPGKNSLTVVTPFGIVMAAL